MIYDKKSIEISNAVKTENEKKIKKYRKYRITHLSLQSPYSHLSHTYSFVLYLQQSFVTFLTGYYYWCVYIVVTQFYILLYKQVKTLQSVEVTRNVLIKRNTFFSNAIFAGVYFIMVHIVFSRQFFFEHSNFNQAAQYSITEFLCQTRRLKRFVKHTCRIQNEWLSSRIL